MTRKRKGKVTALVDITIPVLGRFDLLKLCLESIPEAAGDISYQVIIYDNGSPREEADEFYSDKLNVKIIRRKQNVGFPRACNVASRQGNSPLIFFLNSDIVLEPGSINHLVRAMDEKTIGVVGMKLLFAKDSIDPGRPAGKVQHAGLATNIHGEFVHVFIGWSADHPKVNSVRDVYAVTGAALMTRRELWRQAGGFFEGYGLGTMEDVDYALTVREMGYNIIVEPKAVGTHYTGATAMHFKIPFPLEENKEIFLRRWKGRMIYTVWATL